MTHRDQQQSGLQGDGEDHHADENGDRGRKADGLQRAPEGPAEMGVAVLAMGRDQDQRHQGGDAQSLGETGRPEAQRDIDPPAALAPEKVPD